MTVGERIREIRKALGMTMDAFGEKIGVTKSTISNIENGNRDANERMMKSVCREFDINETWLRTGKGDMKIQRTRNQVVTDFLVSTIKEDDDNFKKRLIEVLAGLEPKDWEFLAALAEKLVKK